MVGLAEQPDMVTCPSCANQVGRRTFCTNCGQPLAATPVGYAAQPPPYQTPAAAGSQPPVAPQGTRRSKGCCLMGCLVALLVPLLVCGVFFGWRALFLSSADRMLGGPSDSEAASAILADMQANGIDTSGVDLVVVPLGGTGEQAAMAAVDIESLSQGDDGVTDYLVGMAQGDTAEQYGIGRVGLSVVGEEGDEMMTVTAESTSIQAYARGETPEESFLGEIDGKVSPLGALGALF